MFNRYINPSNTLSDSFGKFAQDLNIDGFEEWRNMYWFLIGRGM